MLMANFVRKRVCSSLVTFWSLVVPITATVLIAKPVNAEEHTAELDQIVITGTRTPRALEDSPVRVEVITREDLDRLHARSLQDALRYVPGLILRDIGAKGGQAVYMQGLGPDRVLILIDGMPITASTGSTVDLSQIALMDVERIEVVKGALSALYGSSAMGGVINVITRENKAYFAATIMSDLGTYGRYGQDGKIDRRQLDDNLRWNKE